MDGSTTLLGLKPMDLRRFSLDRGCPVAAGGRGEASISTATDNQRTGPNGVVSL